MTQISAIVPAYNGDRYIAQAIESILAQTYTDYEIIVIDDGSIDHTQDVLKFYGDRIRYFSQTNQGVAAARNYGIEMARGEYIAFLDQDDYFLPHKLATQVTFLEKNSHLDFVISGWQIVDSEGKGITAVQPWQKLAKLDTSSLIIWKPVFLGAMLFRRSVLQACGGLTTNLQQTPDVEMVLRLAAMGCQADWVPEVIVCYRQHSDNVSRNSLQQAEELESMLQEFFARSNFSTNIQPFKNKSLYQSLVWSAWRLYHTGNISAMTKYLQKSLAYRDRNAIDTVFNWIESLKNYSFEYGCLLDVYTLTNSIEWQQLIEESVWKK